MSQVRTICVFCASSQSVEEIYREVATDLGRRMGRNGIGLIYGGGAIGLMGCVARGVHEADGNVVGVLPRFLIDKGIDYEKADELIIAKDMRERKSIMDQRSDAFIVLPGGIGTLEEGMEILSMKLLKLTRKPLVFLNTNDYYRDLTAFFEKMIRLNFAKPEITDLFALEPDPESALQFVMNSSPEEFKS